jgi:glycine/D-amino acid oxidase-like deaminating enzyme
VGGHSGYVGCGCLIGVSPAMRPSLERALGVQRELGVRAEILMPPDVVRIEPRVDAAGLGAALYEPDSGYGDPSAVTQGYAEAARRHGVEITQGVTVTRVLETGGRVAGVLTSNGEHVDAPVVVNAAGLWAAPLAATARIDLPIVVGRHPVFVLTRPGGFGPPHMVYLDLAGGAYVRPETGDLSLSGSLTDDEAQHPMDPEELGAEVSFDEAADALTRTARSVPALGDARVSRGYAGAFDITPDWMPILDESPLAGFFIAAGMSGHGFKLAPAIGQMMAARIVGAEPPVSLAPFRLARFASTATAGTFVASYLG